MKKKPLSFLAALFITSATSAQSFAPEAGMNLPNIKAKATTGPVAKTSINPGLLVGGNFPVSITDRFLWQPGVFLKMNGAVIKSDHTTDMVINTVEVPLDFWYRFGDPGMGAFCLGAGPYIALNINGVATWDAYVDINRMNIPAGSQVLNVGYSSTDDIKRYDAGMGFNAAYLLRMGLFIKARYQFGFFNIDAQQTPGLSLKMNAVSISAGYYIKDRKKKGAAVPAKPTREKKAKKTFSPYQDE